MKDLWISRYQLNAASALNSRTQRQSYEGALVRSGSGYGCLHSWPELGDPTLEECLQDLAGEQKTALVRRTLDCIAVDGAAREEGRSLFEGLTVPESHATLPRFDEGIILDAVSVGFSHVKVKVGRDVRAELEAVRKLSEVFPGVKWRIDFNGAASPEALKKIFQSWSPEEKERIDFLEDPCAFDRDLWSILAGDVGIPLANDREMSRDDGCSTYLVVKPAISRVTIPSSGGQRVIITSYLDHPLGQAYAAYEAGVIGLEEVCGLQTHGVFESTAFSECLGKVDPRFQSPQGIGLGFDECLEGGSWGKLS